MYGELSIICHYVPFKTQGGFYPAVMSFYTSSIPKVLMDDRIVLIRETKTGMSTLAIFLASNIVLLVFMLPLIFCGFFYGFVFPVCTFQVDRKADSVVNTLKVKCILFPGVACTNLINVYHELEVDHERYRTKSTAIFSPP